MKNPHLLRGYACASGGAIIWGLSGTAGQYLLSHYDAGPLLISNLRLLIGGILLLAFAARQHRAIRQLLHHRKDLVQLVCYAIFGLLMSQTAFYITIDYSNAGTAAILQTLCVVMVSVLVCITCRRLPTKSEGLSVVLALVGVFLISTHGDPSTVNLSPLALKWGLLTAVASVCYSFLAARLVQKWGSTLINAVGMFIAGIAFTVVYQPWTMTTNLDAFGYGLLGLVIVFGTVITYNLFLRGVGDIGPVKATLLGTLEPVTSSIASACLLGTVFYVPELIGFGCIIATVFLITLQRS